MRRKKTNPKRDALWSAAKRRGRLNDETVRLAKELGLNPLTLIKNIPSPSEPWKSPLDEWIRDLHVQRQARIAAGRIRRLEQAPSASHPPAPVADEVRGGDDDTEMLAWARREGLHGQNAPVSVGQILEEDERMLARQRSFRLVARAVSEDLGRFPAVRKVVLYGSVALPLTPEVPRFRPFARQGVKVLHECQDIDLAVWLDPETDLGRLRRAVAATAIQLARAQQISIAPYHVDTILMDAATDQYLGHLCQFNRCPKGKPECMVPGCGATGFLQQIAGFALDPAALSPERSEILFERSGSNARTPRIALPTPTARPVPAESSIVQIDLFGGRGQVRFRDLLRGSTAEPFTAVLACELEPGGSVGPHVQEHFPEIVVCTAGEGRAWVDDQPISFTTDSVVWLPLGSTLRLENLADNQVLRYLIVKARSR